MWPHHYFPHGAYGAGPWSPVAGLIFIGLSNLFWIGLIGLVVWTAIQSFRSVDHTPLPSPVPEPSPLELLRRRYVMGEIDVVTFEEKLQQLLESEERERIYKLL